MDKKTVSIILTVFKNCKEHFLALIDEDNKKEYYEELLLIIKKFLRKRQLLDNKLYVSKNEVKINLIDVESKNFLLVCLHAVFARCKLTVYYEKEKHFACNELIKSIIAKIALYYGEQQFIEYIQSFEEADFIGKNDKGKLKLGKDISKLRLLSQTHFLIKLKES